MTRTMYDSVTASAIPANAAVVAGYCDQIRLPPWTAADWARFPNAVKVRIAKKPTTNDGHVLDVEQGDATPAQAPGWVRLRRSAGADPTIYCNSATWPAVRSAFTAAGVAEPHYWIAAWDNQAVLPAGAVAKQYQSNARYDLSVVADYWPGVDNPEVLDMQAGDPVHVPNGPNAGQVVDTFEDVTYWTNYFANQIPALVQQVSALQAVVAKIADAQSGLPVTADDVHQAINAAVQPPSQPPAAPTT